MELRSYRGVEMQKIGLHVYVGRSRFQTWQQAKSHIEAQPRCHVCATVFSRVTHVCTVDGNYDATVRE